MNIHTLLETKLVKPKMVNSRSVDSLKSNKVIVQPLKTQFKEELFQLLLMLLVSNSTQKVFMKAIKLN